MVSGRSPTAASSVSCHKFEDVEDGWRWQEMIGGTTWDAWPGSASDGEPDTYQRQLSMVTEEEQRNSAESNVEQPDEEPGNNPELHPEHVDEEDGTSPELHPEQMEPSVLDDDLEDGWRWRELQGTPAALTHIATQARPFINRQRTEPSKRLSAEGDSEVEEGWRWQELDATGSNQSETRQTSLVIEESVESEPAPARPEPGDLVVLGSAVPQEFKSCPAVVTKVLESHCTVVVLDDCWRVGIGECWPSFGDFCLESSTLRLGARIVVEGLQGARTRRLNGFSGIVSLHPHEGHPTFVRKPSAPERPQLTVCVDFDDPDAAGERSVLLEPRFLVPYDKAVEAVSNELCSTLATLQVGQQTKSD